MTNEQAETLAEKIFERLKASTLPQNCTWGEKYPDACKELFEEYEEEMTNDILHVLLENK